MWGKHLSEETKRKIGKKGELHWNWQGGITQGNKVESDKRWRAKNKDKVRLNQRIYKWRKRTAGELNTKIIKEVYKRNKDKFGYLKCILCGDRMEFKDSSLEHLLPLSRGGDNSLENLDIAHFNCNRQKNSKTLKEWFERRKSYEENCTVWG